jgi:predicted  nucleic acid-binding Zn-ribbon protein
MLWGVAAVIALFAVIAAKYLTGVQIQNWRKKSLEAETESRKARGRAKAAESETGTAGRGINTLQRKKKALEKQTGKLRKELAELK